MIMFNNYYDYLIIYGDATRHINKKPETLKLIDKFHLKFGHLFGNMRELNLLILKYEKF